MIVLPLRYFSNDQINCNSIDINIKMLTQVFCFDAYWTFYWIFEGGIPSHYVFKKEKNDVMMAQTRKL